MGIIIEINYYLVDIFSKNKFYFINDTISNNKEKLNVTFS